MKVLEKGPGRKIWERELFCNGFNTPSEGCGSKLLVEESDLYKIKHNTCIFFMCPECGVETVISQEEVDHIPTHVQAKIITKRSWRKRQARLAIPTN
jgi:hypothetical protein